MGIFLKLDGLHSGGVFDWWKFIVLNLTTVVGGMIVNRKERTCTYRFCSRVGRCNNWLCKWELILDHSCDCRADIQTIELTN